MPTIASQVTGAHCRDCLGNKEEGVGYGRSV